VPRFPGIRAGWLPEWPERPRWEGQGMKTTETSRGAHGMALQDRVLSVVMNFQGKFTGVNEKGQDEYGGDVTFHIVGSNPPISQAELPKVMTPKGAINIDAWTNPDPSVWGDSVDIILSLKGYCKTKDGYIVPVCWPWNMNNEDHTKSPAMELLMTDKATRVSPDQVSASWYVDAESQSYDAMKIMIDVKQHGDYYYTPGVIVPYLGNYFIGCDPGITNRGRPG
jgi:hypothetical protein